MQWVWAVDGRMVRASRVGDVTLRRGVKNLRKLLLHAWCGPCSRGPVRLLRAAGHDLTRGGSRCGGVRAAESAPSASSGAGTGEAELGPGGEERVPSDHWEVETVASGASASPAPGPGDPRESAEPPELGGSTETTESTGATGLGQSSATHAQRPGCFVIDPACAHTEDQTGEPWPVYELADDLVEQALGVSGCRSARAGGSPGPQDERPRAPR